MIPFSKVKLNSISKIQHQIQIKITNYATSVTQFSHSSSSSYQSRWHEEESRKVRVSVWWDFENCNLPVNTNVFRVSHNITAAIRACGIKGPVQITAFGDVLQLSRANQEALSSTGIDLTHIPRDIVGTAEKNVHDDTDVKKLPEKLPEITEEPLFIEKVEENEEVGKCSSAVRDDGEGYLKRIWKKWFGNFNKVKECEEKSVADVILDEKCGTRIEGNDVQENSEIIEEAKGEDGNTGILSKKSFSKEMQAFMNSSNGADLVLQSRNRCKKGSNKGSKQGRKSVQRSRVCL
jgi:hypothetical protein